MSDSKGAPRRPQKRKTIDLEASEVKPAEAEAAQAASHAETAPQADDPQLPRTDESAGEAAPAEAAAETAGQEPAVETADEYKPHAAPETGEPPIAAAAKPQKSGAGAIGLVASAVVGGLVALAGYGALNASGLVGTGPGAPPAVELTAMEGEIAALREKIAALETAPAATGSADPARMESLEARIGAVEAEAASLRETLASASPGGQAGDSALAARVETLEARLAEAPAGAGGTDSTVISQLSGKVDAGLEGVNAAMASTGEKIASVENRVATLEQTVRKCPRGSCRRSRQRQGRAHAHCGQCPALGGCGGAALRRAVMAPVEALTGSNPQIDSLKAQAATGLATPASLAASFEPAADAILAVDAPKPEGMVDGLLANARSLIKVRPHGPVAGNSPEAIVSQIRAALAGGDLAAAYGLWEKLPEAQRAASAQWGET